MFNRALYIISIILLLYACGNQKRNSGAGTTYTIATLKGPSSMGMIKMIDSLNNGKEHTVEVKILNEPLQVRKMMLDGTADFALLPTTMAAIIYNKGLNYKLAGIPVWGTLHLYGNDSTIRKWDDLRGRRIFLMARGMTPDVMFRILLQKNGIDPDKDVTLDYTFPTHIDLANAIVTGKAEIGVISEPLASLVSEKNKNVNLIFDLEKEWENKVSTEITETAFLVKDNIAMNNRNIVEDVISGYSRSTSWVNDHPGDAAALMVKYDILPDTNAAINAIPRSNLRFVRASEVRSQIDDYLKVFFNMNPDIVGGKMPDENFIYK